MKKFIVIIDNSYVKHTSRFRPFYGSIVTTNNKSEARLFTRERDAKTCASVVAYRINTYEHEKKKFPNFKKCFIETVIIS